MLELSQSFVMSGSGASLEHNLRIRKGGGIRQNGVPERRQFNEHLLMDESIGKKDYVQDLIRNRVQGIIGDKLAAYNEKCIRNRHYNMVRDLDGWIASQQTERKGKKRSIVTEVVIQVGDRYTGCSYDMQTDEQGRIVDKTGRVIPEWDTRRIAAYRDGVVTESERCKLLKQVYRKYYQEFCNRNPNFVPLSCDIHADEQAGVHMHLCGLFVAKTKTGLGVSLSRTSALAQQYGSNGKNTKTDNAQNRWRADMRQLLEDICKENGIERKDMHNKEKHRSQTDYYAYADARSEAFENQFKKREQQLLMQKIDVGMKENGINRKTEELAEKEAELDKKLYSQVRTEWDILRRRFPVVYKQIHNVFLQSKNVLDRSK